MHSGHCLLGADGAVLAAAHADDVFYAASTIKLAVMAAAARAVDGGGLSWDSRMSVRGTFDSVLPGAGAFAIPNEARDRRLPPDGESATALELVDAMIRWSSNEAMNLLVEAVGFEAVRRVGEDAEANGCRLGRLIGDLAAADAGVTNTVTPAGLARLMWAIVTGRLSSPASRDVMVAALESQEFPVIATVLTAGERWGSKSGWVDGIDHDVAFVGDPQGPELRVLAVCTAGYPGRRGRDEIRRVAASVISR